LCTYDANLQPKNKIAQHLNRSHSTIIREIKRNTDKRGYRYNQADGFAQQRHQAKISATSSLMLRSNGYLKHFWMENAFSRHNCERASTGF
jgi:IS30 family transposase